MATTKNAAKKTGKRTVRKAPPMAAGKAASRSAPRKAAKTAAKKPAARKVARTAAKKPAARKVAWTAAKKPAARKVARTAAKKPAARKVARTAAKKPAARTAAERTPARPPVVGRATKRTNAAGTQAATRVPVARKAPRRPARITPEQALANTQALLAAKQEHDRQAPPWQALDEGSHGAPQPGFQSEGARVHAGELHEGEMRMQAIQGSVSASGRRRQGKRDSREGT